MDEETKKIIDEQMAKLPDDVKEAILSVDYKVKLEEITKRQRLLIDQAGKLEMETTLVMIGLEPLADYVSNLQREMNIPVMRAKEIAFDVSENIFKPIRESLQKMNEGAEKEEKTETGHDIEEKKLPKDGFEDNLSRNKILNEIENPETIEGGNRSMNFKAENPKVEEMKPAESKEIEIRPAQSIEIAPKTETNLLQEKMTSAVITPRQIVEAKPENKLPEVPNREKNRPTSGVDPYREPLM